MQLPQEFPCRHWPHAITFLMLAVCDRGLFHIPVWLTSLLNRTGLITVKALSDEVIGWGSLGQRADSIFSSVSYWVGLLTFCWRIWPKPSGFFIAGIIFRSAVHCLAHPKWIFLVSYFQMCFKRHSTYTYIRQKFIELFRTPDPGFHSVRLYIKTKSSALYPRSSYFQKSS
jgi:hypothetical protein